MTIADNSIVGRVAAGHGDASGDDVEVSSRLRRGRTARCYALAAVVIAAAHLLIVLLGQSVGPDTAITSSIFLLAVVIASLYGGRGPGLLATIAGTLDLNYSFSRPYYSFTLIWEDSLWLIVFVAVALLTSSLQGHRRRAEQMLRSAHRELEQRVVERTAELVRSQEQFSLLVNGVTDQAFFMLDRDGRVASWNPGAARLLGYDQREIVGRPVSLVWPQDAASQPAGGPPVVSLADSRYEDQGWVERKDGQRFWASIVLTAVRDEAGRPRGYAISLRDVTERRSLQRDIVEIGERERQRIGHDLHDGLGQELTGIAMLSTALSEGLAAADDPAAGEAEEIADLIYTAIGHTRDLARGLCPVDLEDDGLASALRQLADRIERLPGIACTFTTSGELHVDLTVAAHLYRIAQEAVNNAIRHGKARHVTIDLEESGGLLSLVVTDDGIGISPPAGTDLADGMGLRLMNHRAKMIRGSLDIRPAPAGGTVVDCRVRLTPAGMTSQYAAALASDGTDV